MTTTATLDPQTRAQLIALTGCAGTHDWKPNLMGVRFAGQHAWASDGYVLGRVTLPGEHDLPERLIPAKVLATYLRRAPKTAEVTLDLTDDEAARLRITRADLLTLVTDEVSIGVMQDLTFPTNAPDLWMDTPPSDDPGPRPAVQAANVARIAALAIPDGVHPSPGIRLYYQGTGKPVVVADITGHVLGLVMPLRDDRDGPLTVSLTGDVEVPA